jgi:motility quorum-sensing regulator / GCU-specific mRNA interferase toxin
MTRAKNRSTHPLDAIKSAFARPTTINRTRVAARDAAALGMDTSAVVAVIQALDYPADFVKSDPAHNDHTKWHDTYKPTVNGQILYLKFTTDDQGRYLLTSFKEATS